MRARLRLLTSLVGGFALVAGLAACGDDDTESPAAVTSVDATAGDDGVQEPTDDAAVNPADPGAGQELVAGCERLDERPDGVYAVGDAGEIQVESDGSTVRVLEVRPAEGWTFSEDDQDDDEVEVTFRRDDRAIDFEAELDDGRLHIEVCEST
jgi:hypothetical protein